MNNVVQLADQDDMDAALKARQARNTVGKYLGRTYPTVVWHVAATADGTTVQVTAPQITGDFGFVLHANQPAITLEEKAKKYAGELLERFRVSREAPDFAHVLKDKRGNAILGPKGGE